MANIGVEYLKPGMVLNSDVKDRNGRLLLNAGVEIKGKHIHIFRTWGVAEVDIEGVTEEDVAPGITEQIDPAVLQAVEAELDELFRHTDRGHPAVKEILRLCMLRKVRHLSGGVSGTKSI